MSIEIGSEFTKEGLTKLKVGQLLRFNLEGSFTEFIITKLNRKSGKVWVKDVTTYLPNEVQTVDVLGNKTAFDVEELDG